MAKCKDFNFRLSVTLYSVSLEKPVSLVVGSFFFHLKLCIALLRGLKIHLPEIFNIYVLGTPNEGPPTLCSIPLHRLGSQLLQMSRIKARCTRSHLV